MMVAFLGGTTYWTGLVLMLIPIVLGLAFLAFMLVMTVYGFGLFAFDAIASRVSPEYRARKEKEAADKLAAEKLAEQRAAHARWAESMEDLDQFVVMYSLRNGKKRAEEWKAAWIRNNPEPFDPDNPDN
jgi:uncharacterized iron-regulated membrane protein